MKSQPSASELLLLVRRIPAAIRERIAERRFRKHLRKVPTRSLGSLGEHEVARFTGRVRPFERQLIEAPLSGRLCVYYDISIEALVNGGYAGQITGEQEAIPFVVEADGHRAAVDPTCARISVAFDHVVERDLVESTFAEREQALLTRLRVDHKHLFRGSVRFREAILEAEETVTVVGGGVREPDPEGGADGYREAARTWLRLVGTERHPVFISDDPRSV